MKKYGYKQVVTTTEFQEGLIVEIMNGKLVCREYKKNEFNEKEAGDSIELDIVKIAEKKTPIGKMREITKQLGTGNYYVDESVILIIE